MIRNTNDKYWFIIDHPKLKTGLASPQIEIVPQMVSGITLKVEKYENLNDTLRLWLEFFIPTGALTIDSSAEYTHDWEMDCGGYTYEEVIDQLYNNVLTKYGDYKPNNTMITNKKYHPYEFTNYAKGDKIKRLHIPDTMNNHFNSTIELDDLKDKITDTEQLIQLIKKFISECTNEEKIEEFRQYLEDEEHNLWVYQKSVQTRLNLYI